MGISKTFHFNGRQNEIATMAKALGHPARVAILEYLMKNRTCIVGDLSESLPLSQSTISQHVKELKNIGLIKGTIEGPSVCYCINEEAWNKLATSLQSFLTEVQNKCC